MKILKAVLLQKHWLNRRLAISCAKDFFTGLGFIWLLLEVAAFFGKREDVEALKSHLVLYLAACAAYAVYANFPRWAHTYEIRDRDCRIELRIGDIFRCRGDIVVPFNDRFDASINGRAAVAPTVQGGLIRSRYKKDAAKLQASIDLAIEKCGLSGLPEDKGKYPLGTVLPVRTDRGTAYLFASSVLKDNVRATGDAQDLEKVLPELWRHIKDEGDKCNVLVPAIGTGHSRMVLRREETVEILVKTFIDSCATATYCNKLTVVLHPDDVVNNKIDFQYLTKCVEAYCMFARFGQR